MNGEKLITSAATSEVIHSDSMTTIFRGDQVISGRGVNI